MNGYTGIITLQLKKFVKSSLTTSLCTHTKNQNYKLNLLYKTSTYISKSSKNFDLK